MTYIESKKFLSFLVCFAVTLLFVQYAVAYQTENVFLAIIDGARYSETFGDETYANVPNMYKLSSDGCLNTEFYNDKGKDGKTRTQYGVCAIITGSWTEFNNANDVNFTESPSIWEYCRKQLNLPQESNYYSFPGEGGFFQPVSFHKEYGPSYWPMRGHFGSNIESWNELGTVMENNHPRLVILYLGETDGAGHNENWDKYIELLKMADLIVYELWNTIQSDPIYQDKTTLIVTNDHGRHNNKPDEPHDGFKDHGDNCDGCQHIMFLAIGPDFKKNYKSDERRTLIDIAPTIAELLHFKAKYATGKVMRELFYEEFPDVNGDKIVNIIDLIIVSIYFDKDNLPLDVNPDVNRDNKVDRQDFDIVLKNFGVVYN